MLVLGYVMLCKQGPYIGSPCVLGEHCCTKFGWESLGSEGLWVGPIKLDLLMKKILQLEQVGPILPDRECWSCSGTLPGRKE